MRGPVATYGLTTGAVAVAFVARWLLDPWLEDHLPFVTFFVAVATAAWLGGIRPALLATGLGLVLAWYFFVPTRFSFELKHTQHTVGLAMYLMASLAFAGFGAALSITKRRADERRELLRTTLASIGDAVITTDTEGRVTSLNPVALTLTGWTHQEAVGRPLDEVFRIVSEQTRRPAENPVKKVLDQGVIVGLANHTVLIRKDGAERAIDDTAAPIRDDKGDLLGVVLVFRDVTETRKADLALRDSETRKTAMFETALDGIISMDHEGKIVEFNAAAEQTFGYRREEVLGRELANLIIPTALRERHRRGMAHYLATGEGPVLNQRLQLTAVRANGGEFPVELSVTRVPSDGPPLFTAYVRDITDRKQAERRVQDALAYSESIVHTVREPLLVLDADLRVKTASRSYCQTFQVTLEETENRSIFDLGARQWDIPKLRALLKKVLAENREFDDYEVEHDFPAIGRRVMLLNGRRIYQEGNHPELILCAIQDVTERRQLERENAGRMQAARFLAAIVESSDDAIVSKSLDGIIQSWNAAAERVFGYTAEQAVGRHISFLFPPDRLDEEDHIIARLRAGERVDHFETVRLRSDGQPVHVSLTISPIKDETGRVIGASKIVRDITERKRDEHERRQSEQRFRMLVEQVKDYAIFMTDARGRATTWNEGVRRVLGFDEAEFIGKDIATTIFTPDDVRDGVAERELEQAAATGTASNHRWMRRKDGTQFFAVGITTGLRDEAGGLIGFMKIMRDQTEQQQMEESLRQYAADLSEADRRKNEFLAMLAHELRNPLAPIRNALQILRLTGAGETVQSASEMMERQMGHMVRLVDDLLDVSRISRGRIELRRGRVELASVVNHAVEAARPPCGNKGLELTVTLPPQPIFLNADPTRLAQVVGNLLNNACKFTNKGGHVWLTVEQVGEEAVIRVRDNGIGIAANQRQRIFDMFMQVDTSLERSTSGLGIGLTLVKNMVEMHGGTVEVHSDGVGQGSEFIVRLPIMVESSEPSSPEPTVSQPLPTARRILVVDDNRDSATSLAMLLKMMGNETETAFDGVEAVEAAQRFAPDVVLLDIGLPKLNGYEAARKIREQPWGKHLLLVALTGWGQEEDRQRSKEAGFDGHMVKPVKSDDLLQLIAEREAAKATEGEYR